MSPSTAPRIVRSLPLLAGLVGCGGELPGSYFEVTLETASDEGGSLKDTCSADGAATRETYTYRVVTDGPDVRLYMGEDLLATGGIDVCTLSYQSTTWQTAREQGAVRWAIVGEAQVGLGSGCDAGWTGTERLEVVESSDPDVPGGCSITYDATGTLDHTVD